MAERRRIGLAGLALFATPVVQARSAGETVRSRGNPIFGSSGNRVPG